MSDDEIIKILKQRIGFQTQREFAKQVGISEKNLSDILHGRRRPQKNLCDFLGVSVESLTERLETENAALKAEVERLRELTKKILAEVLEYIEQNSRSGVISESVVEYSPR
jgi:DNA-binding Lrp family transcriptional regulator